MNTVRPHWLDVTMVTDRNEVAAAFGAIKAWELAVTKLRQREAKATDRNAKRKLRLALLNAETQLQLAKEGVR